MAKANVPTPNPANQKNPPARPEPDVVQDILQGYTAWKGRMQLAESEPSPEAYAQYYAEQRSIEQLNEIMIFASDPFHTDAEVGAEVRRVLSLPDTP